MPLVFLESESEFQARHTVDGPPVLLKSGHKIYVTGAKLDPYGGHCTEPSPDPEERRMAILSYWEQRLRDAYAQTNQIELCVREQTKAFKAGSISADDRYPTWREDITKARQDAAKLATKVSAARNSLRSEQRRREREEEEMARQNAGDALLIDLNKQLAETP